MIMNESCKKLAYETPVLAELGSFEELTQATGHGLHLDATFIAPAGTNAILALGDLASFEASHIS